MTKLISYLSWLLRGLLFLIFFLFAVRNLEPVTLRLWFEHTWQAPLVLVLGTFLVAGAMLGVLSCLVRIFRQRREIIRLKRELRAREREHSPPPPDVH